MIAKVQIKDFRGIREAVLDGLAPLTILTGANGCGKSTLLEAIAIGAHPVPSVELMRCVQRRQRMKDPARWLLPHGQFDRVPSINVAPGGNEAWSRTIRIAVNQAPPRSVVLTTVFPGLHLPQRESTVTFDFEGRASADGLNMPISEVPWVKFVNPSTASPQLSLPELYSQVVQAGRRRNLREILRKLSSGLEDVEILSEMDQPVVHFVFPHGSVPIELVGDGIVALSRLAMELASHTGGVVLVEEPEAHLHPGAIRIAGQVIAAAVQTGTQVVLSTHSLEMIDAVIDALAVENSLDKLALFTLRLDNGVLYSGRHDGESVRSLRAEIEEDLR